LLTPGAVVQSDRTIIYPPATGRLSTLRSTATRTSGKPKTCGSR
jgi:hypothetical protein